MTSAEDSSERERVLLGLQGVRVPKVGDRGVCVWGRRGHRGDVVVTSVSLSGRILYAKFLDMEDAANYGSHIVHAHSPQKGIFGTHYTNRQHGHAQVTFREDEWGLYR